MFIGSAVAERLAPVETLTVEPAVADKYVPTAKVPPSFKTAPLTATQFVVVSVFVGLIVTVAPALMSSRFTEKFPFTVTLFPA